MKILLGHCFYRSGSPSGEDSVYRNEKKLLEENGFEVICFEKFNDDIDDSNSYKKGLVGASFIWSRSAYRELKSLIRATKPDIAHFHNIFPQMSTSVYAACQSMNLPVVQTLHNFRYICPGGLLQRNAQPCEKCVDGSLFNSLKHRCYRNSLIATLPMTAMIASNRFTKRFEKGVNQYIALTEFAKARFLRSGFNENQLCVKPNFVDDVGAVDFQLGEYAIYVGRLSQEKGVHNLIEACKKTKNIPVKILGNGDLRPFLESQVIQHNLNVEFVGFQPKEIVLELLKKSRFLILPSQCYEGFPVTIAEAYACGKPVIGTRIGSLNEIIEEDITGKKFEFGSIDQLASTMQLLWQDVESVKTMSLNARAAYEKLYNATSNLEQLKSIYQRAIEDNQHL